MDKINKNPLNAKSYLLITIFGFIFSIAIVIFFIIYAPYIKEQNLENQLFYIILILFGISTSAFLFGAMNSYASLTGKRFNSNYNLTGPIVGVVLTVLGGFYLPNEFEKEINFLVRTFNYDSTPLNQGEVKVYLSNEIIRKNVNYDGQVVFYIPKNKTGKLKVEVSSEGYEDKIKYIEINKSKSIDLILDKPNSFNLFGKILTADEHPINGVEVNIDGTMYFTLSMTNGSYSLNFKNFNIGDEINVITSHPEYKYKLISLVIEKISQELNIILSPV